MFQLTVSVDDAKADWLYSVEDVMKNKLNSCSAVSAVSHVGRRIYCVFACEPSEKTSMLSALKEGLIEMYAVFIKFDYIKRNLFLELPQLRYEILLRTLVAFDRENERKMLNKIVRVEDGMSLDGYFNFRLGELKERWLEICKLTKSNGMYLYDDETYNELLRFLISAVNPKINKLTVHETDGKYSLTGALKSGELNLSACDGVQLMYYLIDLAPLELVIDGGITNVELFRRLVGIFDAKTSDARKNKTK